MKKQKLCQRLIYTGMFLTKRLNRLGRTIVLLLILSSFGGIIHAQDLSAPGKLEFLSPEATEMKKYLDFPVSMQNGLTDVTVPLYEIDYFGYKLPFELKYHGGGISPRLFDTYGVNWTLHGGGMISRSVMGVPDELTYFNKSDISSLLASSFLNASEYMKRRNTAVIDCEYDEFDVSLPNNSPFKFVIKKQNGICQFLTSPIRKDLKIEMSVTGLNLNSFTIIDKSGVKYIYSEIEQCRREGAVAYTNGWKLKKIILPDNNKEITFEYEAAQTYRVSFSVSRTISDRGDRWVANWDPITTQGAYKDNILDGATPSDESTTPIRSVTYYYFSLLKSVSYGTKNIFITYQNPTNTYFHYYGANIASFEVSGMSKKYVFEGYRHNGQDGFFFLNNIKLVSGQNDLPYYHFSYNPISILFQDALENCWGYICSGASSSTRNEMPIYINDGTPGPDLYYIPTYFIPHFLVKVEGRSRAYNNWYTTDSQFGFIDQVWVNPDDNQYVDLGYGDHNHQSGSAGLLNRIDYPTGGYTTFDYEPNTYKRTINDETNEINYTNGSVAEGGGVRVKTIKKFDQNNALLLEKNYKYGVNECGYGFAPVEETPINFQKSYEDRSQRYYPTLCQCETDNFQYYGNVVDVLSLRCRAREFSIGNFQGLLNGRSPVMYEEVAEYFGHTDDQPNHIGKIVYKYSLFDENGNFPEALEINAMGDPVLTKSHPSRYGQLLEKKIFDTSNTLKSKVNYEYNNYIRSSLDTYINLYFSKMFILNECDWSGYKDINMFQTNLYSIYFTTNNLSREITTEYLNTGTVVTEKNYSYKLDQYDFISSVDETCSDGTENLKEYKYAYEMGTEPYLTMINHNIIGPVVEQKQYKNTQLLETNSLKYRNWGQNVFKPDTLFNQVDGYEKTVENVYNYDPSTGNLLSVTDPGGVTEVYYWGYDNQRNIAKITGLSYSEFDSNTTLKGLLDQLTYYTTIDASNKAALITLNSSIRSNLPQGLITTFTYDPLIGVTSQTDPNGVATYYEYDPFGRLKTTLDNESKVIKHYKYHYKGEPAPSSGNTLTLSTSNQSFSQYGGSITVSVTSNTTWSVSGAPWWLSVSPSSGTGSGSFTITALENSGPLRTANIIVTGNGIYRSIVIEQDPFVAPPNFDLYSLPWTTPGHLTGQEYNPLVYDPSEISLWYNFGYYDTNNYEYIQLETTGDPNPVSVDAVYYNNMGWIDFYYDDVNNRLVFCITNLAPPTDWAIIGVMSRGLIKRISVSVRE